MKLPSLPASIGRMVHGHPSDTQAERNARSLILSGAWLGFIDGGIITYLPVLLARLGGTPTLLSLLSAAPQLVYIIMLVPAGALAERRGNLVQMSNRAALVSRSGFLLIAALPFVLAPAAVPGVAVAIWTAIAVAGAVYVPTVLAVIKQAIPPRRLARVNAGRWAIWTLVGAAAIPLVGAMIDRMPFPTGYQLAFVISFVGALPNLYFFGRIKPPAAVAPAQAPGTAGERIRSRRGRLRAFARPFFQSRPFVRYNVATMLYRLFLFMPAGLYSIYWVDYLQATDSWIGMRGAVAYLILAFSYYVGVKLAHRVGHRSLLWLSGAVMGLYPIITGLAPTVEWLLVAAVAWGVGVAGNDIGLVDLLLLSCPEGRRQPSFVAAANVMISLEAFVGPLLGAALARVIGVPAALLAAGVLIILSTVAFLLLPNHAQEQAAADAAPAA